MAGIQRFDYRTVAIAACLAIAILLVDVVLPLGVAGGVPYVAVILCGWWLPRARWVLLLAVAASLLTAVGYFLSQDGGTPWVVLTNRFLALFAIWVTAALVIRAKQSDLALRAEQNHLERRVAARTGELAALNRDLGKSETDAVEAWRRAERAERRLTGAIESLPQGFAFYDAEDRLVLCNRTYVEQIQPREAEPPYGRTFEDILRRWIVARPVKIAPEQREAWLADRVAAHRRAAGQIEVHAMDGHRYAVTERRTPEGDIAVISTDVTERRKAEDALRESQALLKAVVDHAPVGIAIKDRNGRYILIGPRPKTVSGVTSTDMLGKTAHDFYPRELADAAVAHDRAVLESGEASEAEYVVPHEDGPRTILNVKFPIPDAEGATASIGSIAIDITDRKRAEDALRDSERTLSTLMRNLPGMAYRCENEKTWSADFTSTGSEALTGYSAEDLRKQKISCDELIHPDDRDWVWDETQAALAENRPFQYSYRIITKTGEEKWVWEQGSRVSEPGCKPEILVGFISDITEQRRMQEHLRESDKLSALGQLASGVAHDFNNILMVINGYANLALREPNNVTKTETALSRIVTAADKAAGLTKQLLVFSRRQAIERREIAVAGVLEEVQTLLVPLLGETIELHIDPADPDLHVNTDSAQISQALVNLAINARDAMPGGGEIVIQTGIVEPGGAFYRRHPGAARGLHVAISVADNGTGMDEKTAARVFEPFFTTKEQGKGTGLGLAMVYGFVQQSEGAVEVATETGAGTTVTIYLPALRRQPDVAEARGGEAMSARGETILMAEDDQDLRELTQLFLEDLGYTVLPAKNGLEAREIEAGHEGRIDLLLTDAVMPGCGGHELCQLFRKSRPGTPVLMMSGYPTRGEFSNLKLPDDIPFLQKPVDPESLARRLRELLDPQAEPTAEPALRETA